MGHRLLLFSRRPRSTLLSGLSLYLKLDEAGGTRADASGNVTAFTDNNTCLSAAGQVGDAVALVAPSAQSLSHASVAALQTGNIDFTWTIWANLTSKAADRTLIGKGVTTAVADIEFWSDYKQATDRFRFVIGDAAGAFYTVATADVLGSPSTATWYHIAIWHDSAGDTINIIVNGGAADSITTAGRAVPATAGALAIGSLVGSAFMDGLIDEVKLWRRVLTIAEIAEDYANGLAGRALF